LNIYSNIFYLLFFSKSQEEKQLQERIEKLLNILNGEITIGVHMQFLIKNNHADLLILKQIKVNYSNLFFFV
jgi:26S proteasome regulatory subunit N2